MNKYLQCIAIIAISFFLMGFECEDTYSPRVEPYNELDTTNLIHLDTTEYVKISLLIWEYDTSTLTKKQSIGANVYFSMADTNLYTDSTGYVHLTFSTNTMPFKYEYEVKKDGFKKRTNSNWDTVHVIIQDVFLYKKN